MEAHLNGPLSLEEQPASRPLGQRARGGPPCVSPAGVAPLAAGLAEVAVAVLQPQGQRPQTFCGRGGI